VERLVDSEYTYRALFFTYPRIERVLLVAAVVDAKDFDRAISVNVRGMFLCYKHGAKQMISQGRGGRIIGEFSVPTDIRS